MMVLYLTWIILIVVAALVSFIVGHNFGRLSERNEPGSTDQELVDWIVRRRMLNRTQADIERICKLNVEQEIARRENKGWAK